MVLTCVTCNVWFKEAEPQRQHYKTDWHRYNLKRKVVGLPPVSAEAFVRRVKAQQAQTEAAVTEAAQTFEVCSSWQQSWKQAERERETMGLEERVFWDQTQSFMMVVTHTHTHTHTHAHTHTRTHTPTPPNIRTRACSHRSTLVHLACAIAVLDLRQVVLFSQCASESPQLKEAQGEGKEASRAASQETAHAADTRQHSVARGTASSCHPDKRSKGQAKQEHAAACRAKGKVREAHGQGGKAARTRRGKGRS